MYEEWLLIRILVSTKLNTSEERLKDWFSVSAKILNKESRKKEAHRVKAKNAKECNKRESRSIANMVMSEEDENEIRQSEGRKRERVILTMTLLHFTTI